MKLQNYEWDDHAIVVKPEDLLDIQVLENLRDIIKGDKISLKFIRTLENFNNGIKEDTT